MWETLLQDFKQPEYIHVLINPLPVYGLAMGIVALGLALVLRGRRAAIVALALLFISGLSAWPVSEYGEQGFDRVQSMADSDGQAWLDEHLARADRVIWIFYVLAGIAALALVAVWKFPRLAFKAELVALIWALVTVGAGGYIAYAGGKVRHREFRNVPPPPHRAKVEEKRS